MTLLRHPVRRFISYYNYIRDHRGHPAAEKIQAKDLNLKGFMDDQGLSELPENQQTKFLTGDFSPGLEAPARAVENIENYFLFVGLTEHFDEDLLCLSKLLDWLPPYYYRRNTSRNHTSLDELDAGVVREIIERNQLDMALYEYVKARRADRDGQRTRIFQTLNWLRNMPSVRRLRRYASIR